MSVGKSISSGLRKASINSPRPSTTFKALACSGDTAKVTLPAKERAVAAGIPGEVFETMVQFTTE